jgi:hypothetical protein
VKPIVFGVITAAITILSTLAPQPAEAGRRCRSGGYSRTRYVTTYRYSDYDDYGYGGGGYRRYASYGGGRRCGRRSYVSRRYRPSYRSSRVYTTYYSAPRRYSCGCGQRFASSYWLSYHRDHTDCY